MIPSISVGTEMIVSPTQTLVWTGKQWIDYDPTYQTLLKVHPNMGIEVWDSRKFFHSHSTRDTHVDAYDRAMKGIKP